MFKVGDKVKYVKELFEYASGSDVKLGAEGIVTGFLPEEELEVEVLIDNTAYSFMEEELEKI